ncbi:MAG TPA: DUF3617 domain-containing protein [Sphingomonas sp.]|nr:DUF3617 domain-containing protein [Sphingomonas sp.]
MRALLGLSSLVLAAAPLAAQKSPILAGLWETVLTINSVDMPNAPPAVAKMMRGHKTVVKHCATAKDVAKGPQEMLKSSPNCHFTRYSMTGGHFSSEMVCNQNGMKMTSRSEGNFTPTSFTATGSSEMSGPRPMRMTTTVSARRLGDCH